MRMAVIALVTGAVLTTASAASAATRGAAGKGSGDTSVNTASASVTMVQPQITVLPDGATRVVFAYPDGEISTSVTPPKGFDPLSATPAQLSEFDFPPRPDAAVDLQQWTDAMSAYKSSDPPTQAVPFFPVGLGTRYVTCPTYCPWGGWVAGTWQEQSHHYTAVKSGFRVPTNVGTCGSSNITSFWIGLGGTATVNDSILQQGITCGDPTIWGGGPSYHPFYEFANQGDAKPMCANGTLVLNATNIIYQNMSFQTSSNTAYFYMENQSTGKSISCHDTPPPGWSFNGNTADWAGEAIMDNAVQFNPVDFYNVRAELYSNSTWVTIASQTHTATVDGQSSTIKCIYPSSLGTDGASFSDYWHSGSCFL